jgi:hypothetical protein
LALNGDGGKAVLVCGCLGLLYPLLQQLCGFVALFSFRDDEAQRDQVVWVAQLDQVVPVLLIEAREGRQDEHAFAVADWVRSSGDIVHVVVDYGRWSRDLVGVLLLEG